MGELSDAQRIALGIAGNLGGLVVARGKLTVASGQQTLSIPVADGENNGRIVASGRLVGDVDSATALRDLTVKINGAATNVAFGSLQMYSTGPAQSTARLAQFSSDGGLQFQLQLDTARGAGIKRVGLITAAQLRASSAPFLFGWAGYFYYNDSATVITSVDLVGSTAVAFQPGSYVVYEELKLP